MRRVRVWAAATGEMSKTAPRAMQPRTKWIVTVFIGLLSGWLPVGYMIPPARPKSRKYPRIAAWPPRGFTPKEGRKPASETRKNLFGIQDSAFFRFSALGLRNFPASPVTRHVSPLRPICSRAASLSELRIGRPKWLRCPWPAAGQSTAGRRWGSGTGLQSWRRRRDAIPGSR